MGDKYLHKLIEDPKELAKFGLWSEEVYKDLLDYQSCKITEDFLKSKYIKKVAILCLDITGFTITAIEKGELYSFIRILDVQKVCGPVFHQFNAYSIRAFADNFTVLFDDPKDALMAANEVHHRISSWNHSGLKVSDAAECCIGIGYGPVFTIGLDHAMGKEMNKASKLGEDIARGAETLLTEGAFEALKECNECHFRRRIHEGIPFPFYEVLPK